jgi:HPt (histidine-containing phosphotransfer) domain-containing protein
VSESLDALQHTFAMLRAKYQVKLPGIVAQIDELWQRVLVTDAPASELTELIQITHNISGNGKTFGFASASETAREIELCLEPICIAGRQPDAGERERVEALLATLKHAAQ